MRIVSTALHSGLDYTIGVVLLLAPAVLGFVGRGASTWIPMLMGVVLISYSLLTDYELGIIRWIRMPVHRALDAIGGLFLAASPWIFQFADTVWIPHLAIGLLEIGLALTTENVSTYHPPQPATRQVRHPR